MFIYMGILNSGYAQTKRLHENIQKKPPLMNANNQKELALAHSIINAFIQNKHELWVGLYPSDAEFKMMLQAMMSAQPALLSKQKMDEMLAERKAEAIISYTQEFEQLRKGGDSLGIDWSKTVFDRFEYDASPAENLHGLYLNGRIFFSSAQQHFMLYGIEALQIGSTYRLQTVKSFAKLSMTAGSN